MSLGLVGRKVGMTRILPRMVFHPVTVLDVSNNRVTRSKRLNGRLFRCSGDLRCSACQSFIRLLPGHLAKAGVEAGHVLKEFRVDADRLSSLKAGDVGRC